MDASIDRTSCNVKMFYGKKKPLLNLRWVAKKNAFQTKDSTSHTMKMTPSKHTNPSIKTSKRKPTQTAINNKDDTGSLKRMPKRLCKRDNICYSPLVNRKNTEKINKKSEVLIELDISKLTEENKEADSQTSMSSSVDTDNLHSPSQSTCSSPPMAQTIDGSLSCHIKYKDESTENVEINNLKAEKVVTLNSPKVECNLDSNNSDNSDNAEDYEMFNCDVSDTSYGSHTSISPKKKSDKKTILNYFPRVDDVNAVKYLPNDRRKERDAKNLKNKQQLHFSKKGLSPKSTKKNEESPLFDLPTSSKKSPQKNKRKNMKNKTTMEQMYIDIGQKDFGHVKCETCDMVYTKCQEEDEAQHAKYHQKIVQKLKFNGWKSERVVEQFHDGRIIAVHNNDYFMHLKKLAEIREVVDSELGFAANTNSHLNDVEQAFLFISTKKVIGCVIAISIKKAYPVLLSEASSNNQTEDEHTTQSWCCSSDPVKAVCGISRVWVFSKNRRQKIASRLVDCVRRHFLYGCLIDKSNLAFSDPTPNGRAFAEMYVGKKEILVFR